MCTKYLLLDPRYEPIGDSIPKVGKHRCTDISRSISRASILYSQRFHWGIIFAREIGPPLKAHGHRPMPSPSSG